MQAQLRIRLSDDESVEGPALDAPPSDESRASVRSAQELSGSVTLVREGAPGFEIVDALDALIPRMCLAPLAALAAGEAVTVRLYSSTQTVTLTPDGAETAVVASWGPEGRFPTEALAEALGRCAVQYAGFLARNLLGDPAGEDRVERLNRTIRTTPGTPPLPDAEDGPPEMSEQEMREIVAEMQEGT